jgi:hypothetical protein
MKSHEVKLVYEGKVTHQITKAFISLAEAQMEENEETASVQRVVFHVMVECLQNISRHADDCAKGNYLYSGKGIFMVCNTKDTFLITTGNAVLKDKIKAIIKMIDRINGMNDFQLKDLYMKQMREGTLSEKGGAGLGLIDIRRKTGNKLEYHFIPLSDTLSFFLLTATIPRTK